MKKLILLPSIILAGLIAISAYYNMSTDGTPGGYTGSPSDEKDCSSCHTGKVNIKDGIFKINCEGNKYEPGKSYTVTATIQGKSNSAKFGFQISPQNLKGKLMGKIIVTNTEETKLIEKGKYLNQTRKGVDGNGTKTWSFEWVAPAKGSGDITFYGSFLIGGRPEIIYNSSLTLKEK